jgi:RimJ/RimL family protein N-acetyltransferase
MIDELDIPEIEIPAEPAEGEPLPHEPIQVVYYMGDRIDLRPIELTDEPLLRRWVNDPLVRTGLLHRGPINAVREREWIESLGKAAGDYVFGIVARSDDRLIGTAGLHRIDPVTRSATFGLLIGDREYQNRGYGTEATKLAVRFGFRELNLNRIALSVLANNWRAIRVYQNCGFRHEGCLRQAQYRGGGYVDEYRFSLLREEWDALPTVVPVAAGMGRCIEVGQ